MGAFLEGIQDEAKNIAEQEPLLSFFDELKTKDQNVAQNIIDSFAPSFESIRAEAMGVLEAVSSLKEGSKEEQIRLELDLYKSGDRLKALAEEIRAKLSPYVSYSETMARREADLEKFARSSQNAFLSNLFDRVGEYFDEKETAILRKIEERLTMTAMATDSFVKPFAKVASSIKGLTERYIPDVQWKSEESGVTISMKKREKDDHPASWAATTLESIFKEEIVDVLGEDLKQIISEEKSRFEEEWKKKVSENSPNIDELTWFSRYSGFSGPGLSMELHPSTQVVAASIATALTGTLALAAGWHTLEYALAAVFPPAAIASLLLGSLVFFVTKDREKEKEKQKVKEQLKMLYQTIIFRLYKEPLDEKGRTLREILDETCIECVNAVMKGWEQQISGNLALEDYRKLVDILSNYAFHVEKASELLKRKDSSKGGGVL